MIKQELLQFDGAYRLAERLAAKGFSDAEGWYIKSIIPIIDCNGATCGFYVLVEKEIHAGLNKELLVENVSVTK